VKPRIAALLCAALWVGSACTQQAVVRDGRRIAYERAVQEDLASARRAIDAGSDAQAQAILERFLVEFRGAPQRSEARLLLADIYARGGDLQRAVRTWRELAEADPSNPFAAQARLRGAQGYRTLGRPEVALRFLQGVDPAQAPVELRPALYRLLADLAREQGDFAEAVRALAQARAAGSDAQANEAIDFEVSELLRERLSEGQLEQLLSPRPVGVVGQRAALELARRRLAGGQAQAALEILDSLAGEGLAEAEFALATGLRQQASSAAGAVATIGLALPLSGEFAGFGQAALRGFTLGLDLFGGSSPAAYRVIVRDTAGESARAGAAVEELIREGARAVVGPMRSSEAAAAAPAAQSARVPLIALARSEELTREPSYVFRTATAQLEQARALVEFAMDTLEARRFAILYPRDRYGIDFRTFFWDEVERRGGQIVAVEGYPPEAVDIQDEIKKLVGLAYLTPEERARVAERDRLVRRRDVNAAKLLEPEFAELPPYVDFDAIFIPDVAANAGVVLPQLRFYDVRDVVLLGPSDWNDPTLAKLAPNESEDAIFVDSFYAASEEPAVQEFVARYRAIYGDAPDAYAAEGFDTARLLGALATSGVPMASDALLAALRAVPAFPAVAGLSGFDPAGAPIKKLHFLTVERGRIREYVPGALRRGGR
jgi:branched-chain amino acid transport system substrate-binding protein